MVMSSRYASQTGSTGDTRQTTTGTSTTTGSSSQSTRSSETSNTTSTSSGSQRTSFNVDFMSGVGRQALSQLIATLSAGGTEEQRKNKELALQQINNLDALSQSYDRQTAFADAEGLMNQILRQALESSMPSILQSQAAAGTSGDALSALLTQDLAVRSSEAAAAQGLGAAVDYGNILAQLQGQQTNLIGSLEDTVTQALLQALQADVGSAKRGTETTTSKSQTDSETKSKGSQSSSQSSTQTTNNSQTTDTRRTNSI